MCACAHDDIDNDAGRVVRTVVLVVLAVPPHVDALSVSHSVFSIKINVGGAVLQILGLSFEVISQSLSSTISFVRIPTA